MKKIYMKPVVVFESFAMSTHIAGDCEKIMGNPTQDTCAYTSSGGVTTFTDSIEACDYTPEDMGGKEDEWDGFCYHVPTTGANFFNS